VLEQRREKHLILSKLYMTIHFITQRKHRAHFKKDLIPFGELIVTYCENDTKRLKTICEQNVELQNITAWGIYVIIMKLSSINVMISVAELY
jgi:hypothetical protein